MAPLRLPTLLADQFRVLSFRKRSSAIDEHPTAYGTRRLATTRGGACRAVDWRA